MTEQRDIDLRAYDYAPGHYLCKCMHCGQHHEADKRALSCETCAMRRALVDFQARAEKAESALATAEAAGIGRAAKVAEAHKGAAERKRMAKGMDLSRIPPNALDRILAEEDGENIAAAMIAEAIRALIPAPGQSASAGKEEIASPPERNPA